MRRLNQFVEQRAPWNLAKERLGGPARRDPLRPGGRAAGRQRPPPRLHTRCCGQGAWGAGRRTSRRAAARRRGVRSAAGRLGGRADPAPFPEDRGDRDSSVARAARVEPRQVGHADRRLGDLGRLVPADQDRAGRLRAGRDRLPARAAGGGAPICGDPGARRRRPRGAREPAPPPARHAHPGDTRGRAALLADRVRRDADHLGADRRADLTGPVVRRAARAGDRPTRSRSTGAGPRPRDRLRRSDAADRGRHGRQRR